MFLFDLMPVIALSVGALMVILRAGASRVFFDVVGSFQATRLIDDAQAKVTVMQGIMLDGLSGIGESITIISDQMQRLVDATVPLAREVAEARIEFEKFANFAGAAEVEHDIIRIGESMGFTADQALQAGARMAQLSGIVGGGAAVGAATETGIEFGLIGGMQTEAAMQRMVNLQQQTNFMYGDFTQQQIMAMDAERRANVVRENSIRLLNQLNTVENRSAATMEQITFVMNQFASQGDLVGDSITFMASASATLIEAGEEQGKAGRALRMMYARLGANTANNRELLAQYGIEVVDTSGNLRTMEEIIGDMADAFTHLSEEQKIQLAQAIAGNDHYVRALKLIENNNRTMLLNAQAISEVDTAQAELNRRLEDEAFLLQKAEARLSNAQSLVGNELVPVVTAATNVQAAFNEQLAQMAGEEGFGALFRGAYMVQQYMQVFAPMGEAYMNILSMNVSLNTQRAIMRAINGEEIVRASAYGARTASHRASLQSLQNELSIIDQMVQKEIFRAQGQQKQANEMSARMRAHVMLSDAEEASTRGQLLSVRGIVEMNERRLAQAQHIKMFGDDQERQALAQAQADMNMLQLEKEEAQVQANITREMHAQRIATELLLQRQRQGMGLAAYQVDAQKHNLTLEQAALRVSQNKNFLRNNAATIDQAMLAARHQMNNVMVREQQMLAGNLAVTTMTQEQIEAQSKHLMGQADRLQDILNLQRMRQVAEMTTQDAMQSGTQVAQVMLKIENALAAASRTKGNAQAKQAAMNEVLRRGSIGLAQGTTLEASAIAQVLRQLPPLEAHYQRVAQQEQALFASRMALNTALMQTSGVLGAASMVFGMFAENEDAARASMILMTLSMAPATLQMMGLAGGAASAAAGLTTYGAAATGAAAASGSLLAVIRKMGPILIALSVVGAVAYKAFTRETEEAEDALSSLNSEITYSAEMFNTIASQYDTRQDVADALLSTEQQIADLEEDMNLATATNLKHLDAQLQNLLTEREVLEDILSLENARAVVNGEVADFNADTFFKQAQEYADSLEAQEATNTMLTLPTLLGFGPTIETNIGLGGFDLGPLSREVGEAGGEMKDLQAISDELFANIPEHLHGAVLEIAMAADSAEEFMLNLEQFADDTGFLFDFLGDGITESFIGPIEQAKNALFEFNNEREELFFGMSKGNITGDMVKQVVNKGVETLINTTEVIMTNTFNGMTTTEAANEILRQVESGLEARGVSLA